MSSAVRTRPGGRHCCGSTWFEAQPRCKFCDHHSLIVAMELLDDDDDYYYYHHHY